MNAFWAIVKKELSSVARDRTILIAILIQLFIASFSSALLVGLLSLYDVDSVGVYTQVDLKVGIVGQADPELVALLKGRGVTAAAYPSLDKAEVDYRAGEIGAILTAPSERNGLQEMRMFIPPNETVSSAILMTLQDPLKRYENLLRSRAGIPVRYTDLKGSPPTAFEFIYSVIIPMLMLFPAFVTGSMVVDSLTEEVENNTLETLLSAPLSLNSISGAKITASLLLAAIQCALWLGLLGLNRIEIHNAGWVLLLATFIAAIIAVGAAIIAAMFKDRERSQFVYSLFTLVAASSSYLFNASPIKTISRLAIGDYYTGPLDLLAFAVVLAVMLLLFFRLVNKSGTA